MRKLRRIGLYFLIFIAFWVITFTFEHFHPLPPEDAPSAIHTIASQPSQPMVTPTPTFLPASKEIPAANMWTYECELILQKPSEETTTCADFGIMVRAIHWDQWSQGRAFGTGIYSINDCTPNCADGKRHESPVTVELSDFTKVGDKYLLNTFTFSSQTGENLPLSQSPDQSWDVSEFYRNVPGMH
ncbi:MAG: hypothetical protein WCQ52_07560 [Actinomycetes bacterium]